MVIDNETLTVLHPLTEEGEEVYRHFLVFEADKLIYFSKHPVKKVLYAISKLFELEKLENNILKGLKGQCADD